MFPFSSCCIGLCGLLIFTVKLIYYFSFVLVPDNIHFGEIKIFIIGSLLITAYATDAWSAETRKFALCVGQPGFLYLLDNRLPYNIYPPWAKIPETFPPRAGQTRLNFRKFRFFSDFWGGALPKGRWWGRCLGCGLLYSGRTTNAPNFSRLRFLVPEI